MKGVLDHLAAGGGVIGSSRLLGIQGRIGLSQHSGGIKGSSLVRAAAVGIRQFGADGGHHHVGINAQAAHCSAHQVLIHIQVFPGGDGRFPGRDGALVHLGQGGRADSVDTHACGDGGAARTKRSRVELRGHPVMSIHGKVLVGRHGAVIHDRCSLAVQIVDGNRRSRRTHGTSHTGHDRCYRSAAVGCHFHGTGTSLAVFLTCRYITVYKFCIGGEVIVDHAHTSSHGAGNHSRRHCCRSADQSGLMVVFGRDVQALVVADDVLHGGGHGAVQFGGGGCCRYCA